MSDVFLPVRDVYRSMEWYEKVLGFRRLRLNEKRGAAGMTTGDGTVGFCLVEAHPFKPVEFPPNKFEVEFSFNLATDDIDAAHKKLDDGGVDLDEITPSFDGTFRCFSFRDPDGNRWSVVQNG